MSERDHISIRKFRSSELIVIKRLIYNTIDVCYQQVYCKEAIKFFKDYHNDENILKGAKEGYTFVLEKNNRIIGTGTIVEEHIMRVFVIPEFQKFGFGKLIMHNLEEKALSTGVKIVKLDASLPSKRFYDSLGYVTIEKTFLEVENGKKLDYYKMDKSLTKIG